LPISSPHKIKGFTLREMLVGIIVSTIAIVMAFTIYTHLSNMYFKMDGGFVQTNKRSILQQRLSLDFNTHAISYLSKDGIDVQLISPLDTVVYRFDDSAILRNTDTLMKDITFKSQYFYQGEAQTNGSIDALKVIFSNKGIDQAVFAFRERSSQSIVRNYGN